MDIAIFSPLSINELGNRDNQEDSIYPAPNESSELSRCFVLCDGMGGLDAGEVASAAVCKSLGEYVDRSLANEGVFTDTSFEEALSYAYDQLDKATTSDKNMGTTLAMICFHSGGCLAAYIGDSRIYHFRPSTGEILYRSRDHSLVYQLLEEGEISLEEMKTSPLRNVILRAMLPAPKPRTVADLIHITDIAPDDYFLMGSDGMFENLEDSTILEILNSDKGDKEKCEELKHLSKQNNDNHSAYIVHIKDVSNSEIDNSYPDNEREARNANKVLKEENQMEEVTVVDNSQIEDESSKEDMGKDNVNLNPVQLKHSGEKLSLAIIVLTVIVITAAVVFFFLHST